MAVEDLTAQTTSRTGAKINLQSVTTADGFKFPNGGQTLLVVNNDAGALVLNFTIQATVDSEAVSTKDVTVTASEEWIIGPFPQAWYNDASGDVIVAVDADLVSGVAVVKMGS